MSEQHTDAPSADAKEVLEEIRKTMGFIPPALGLVARDPMALRVAWLSTRTGYLENPLPPLFKEQFMAVIAKFQIAPYSLIVRSCSLRRLGMSPAEILDLLKAKIPPATLITEGLRVESVPWGVSAGWVGMPGALERWVMWAAVRMALRKDPGGRCRKVLREVLGESNFNKVVILCTFAAMQRVWIDAHPEADPAEDARVKAEYEGLLAAAPEFAQVWDGTIQRAAGRQMSERERRLLGEISKLDLIRRKLRDSELRFRRVVRNAAYPIMIYAEDGEVVMLNKAWKTLSGWTRKQIPTVQSWSELAEIDKADWSPQDLAAFEGWKQVIEEGEQRIQTPGGQVRRWDFSTAALGKLGDGRNAYMRMAVDVTERRALETVLWSRNQHITNILESITDGFVAIDREHRVTWVNTKAAEMFRWDREAVFGRLLHDILPVDANTPIVDQIVRCMEDGQTRHIEYHSLSMQAPIEAHVYAWPDGLSIFFRDISERKNMEQQLRDSERRFRTLFNSGMFGVFVANIASGAIIDCNDAFLKTVGYTRDDLTQGRLNWRNLTPPEWSERDQAAAEAIVRGPLVPYEKEYFHKDGHRIPIMIGAARVDYDHALAVAFVIDRTGASGVTLS